MQAEKPWKLVKSTNENEKARAYSVVSLCANISCLLSNLVEPFMPNLSSVMLKQLNANLDDINILAQNKDEERSFRYKANPDIRFFSAKDVSYFPDFFSRWYMISSVKKTRILEEVSKFFSLPLDVACLKATKLDNLVPW